MKIVGHLSLFFSIIFLFSSCKKIKEEYYPSGNLKSRIEYRFGKEHGEAVYYFEEYNRPSLKITMKNGKMNGELLKFFYNGKVETQTFYVDDIQEGVETLYDLQGNRLVETHYVHGIKEGQYTSWHDGGDMIREKGAFKQDMFDGQWVYYDDRGFLVGEGEFTQGNGNLAGYDQNGNLMRITTYVNNLKHGDDIHFLPNGDTLKIVTYVNDRIEKTMNMTSNSNYEE